MEQRKPTRNSRQRAEQVKAWKRIYAIQRISATACALSLITLLGTAGADSTNFTETLLKAVLSEAIFIITFFTWNKCKEITEKARKKA